MQIDQNLNKWLIKTYGEEIKTYDFEKLIETIEDHSEFSFGEEIDFVDLWVSGNSFELSNNLSALKHIRRIYTITHLYTFHQNSYGKTKLYRGITGKKKQIERIINEKKIRTNPLSSFTTDFNQAYVFGDYKAQGKEGGVVFSVLTDTKDILMTHMDWLGEHFLEFNSLEGHDEEEFVVINENNKTLDIKIEMVPYT